METCVKSEKSVKKEFKSPKGTVLLIANLKVPCLGGNDIFQKNTQKLYDGVFNGFLEYCEKRARKNAAEAAAAEAAATASEKKSRKSAAEAAAAASGKKSRKGAAEAAAAASEKKSRKDAGKAAAAKVADVKAAAGKKSESTGHIGHAEALAEPLGGVLKYAVTFENKRLVSILIDASIYDGKGQRKAARLSQVWSKAEGRLLHFYDFFNRADREKILSLIHAEAESKAKLGLCEYKPHLESRIERYADFSNFYLVPGGYAFYFAPGELSDSHLPEVFITAYKGETLIK